MTKSSPHVQVNEDIGQDHPDRLPVNPLTLSFPEPLEKSFLDKYLADILPIQRLALLSAALLYGLFAVLDILVVQGDIRVLWIIRFAVVCPLVLGAFCLSFSPGFKRYSQILLSVVLTTSALGIILMAAVVPSPVSYLYYAGLILTFFFLYTFSCYLFTNAALTGLFIVVAYEVVAIQVIHTPSYILINNNFFFITANFLGMFACYYLEKSTRRNFYLAYLLEQERAKVAGANEVLERKVEERSRQLEKAHRQLVHSEKLATAGLLAASVVHEFGSPIFAIRNFLENLQKSAIAEEDKAFAALAVEECSRLRTLLGSLRDFHRPTSGRKEAVELHQILDDIVLLCGNRLQEHAVVLEKHYASVLPSIQAVRDQLKQVTLNLLTNAIDSVAEQEGERRVSISTGVQPDAVVMSIEDNGRGIAPYLLERIFEPFVSNKEAKIGTGLGLSIAYGIIRAHGGSIEAENNDDSAGARFKVTLPLEEKETGKAALLPFHAEAG